MAAVPRAAVELHVSDRTAESHLVVLVTRYYHETDVRRWKRTLEQRNAFTARQSDASLVRRFADGTDSNAFVVENHAHLVGAKTPRFNAKVHGTLFHAANIETTTGSANERSFELHVGGRGTKKFEK